MKWLGKLFVAFAIICALLVTAWLSLPKPPLLDGISFSRRVFDRNGQSLCLTLSDDQKYRIFTPLSEISPELIRATLAQEDRFFGKHPGVNPIAGARAAWHFSLGRSGRGGASTITMQLARLRFHLRTRTVSGKCMQVLCAFELERHYSKAQILEAYLNLAPYGGNLEGAGAASEIYFHKATRKLTVHEAVALSVIPQSPTRRVLHSETRNAAIEPAQRRLNARLGDNSLDRSFAALAQGRRSTFAPHFTTGVLRDSTKREIRTTLDLDLQHMLERRIAEYVEANTPRGIHNAAAMLIDSRSMEVLAQVGSADFTSEAIDGQVDATRSARSPGSTLKPFVYALALDQGLIHPLTMLKDSPRSFGSFNPENFDRDFVGPIKANEALARSRNIPAVTLASQLTSPTLYRLLQSADLRLPGDEKFYGLALPLGGAEVTMEDLVRLYSALANNGELRPLHRTFDPDRAESRRRLFTPEAAFLTLEMLGQIPRPGVSESSDGDAIFWKTGTSHGFHDAWSVSVFDHYVLAVWVGNADGKSNPAFIGRTCAAPLLFQIIDTMRAAGRAHPARHEPPPNTNLRQIEFCAVSGQIPTAACSHRIQGWFIPGVSPIGECEIHRAIWVDAASALRVNANDGTREVRREICEFWPSDLLELFQAAGLPRRLPPPFLPGASVDLSARTGKAPRITSPKNDTIYSLAANESRTLSLRAETEGDVAKVYWFADRAFLGVTSRTTPLNWEPNAGHYTITALDDHGRSDSRAITCTR